MFFEFDREDDADSPFFIIGNQEKTNLAKPAVKPNQV